MIHHLYIIYSSSVNKYYVGETHNTVGRLIKHNAHSYGNSFTKIASDWNYVLIMECQSKQDAIYLERFIKRMKSRKFIEKVIKNQKILKDILDNK